MDLMDILMRTGGVEAIAKQLGVPPAMAEMGAKALLPAVVGGFKKQTVEAGGGDTGLGSLINILGGLGGGGLATNVLNDAEPTNIDKGNDVLGQIFGSKDVSRSVAGHAAGQTGIDPELLKKMLPIVAMLVAGYLSHQGGAASAAPAEQQGGGLGGLGSILGSILGGGSQASAPAASSGGLGGALGGLGSMLDLNGDGNPLDDIIGMAGKLAR